MGWLQLVGSIKLQVSFAKDLYKRDYILQKRPIVLRSLLIVATPYVHSLEQFILEYTSNCATGWQRPLGCLKLQIIFRKRATNYRALLRKTTSKDMASYGSSPSCTL